MLRIDPRHARCSEADRVRVLRRYACRPNTADLERLVVAYQPLARTLARRFAAPFGGGEDYEQVASEGLIKAIKRYDPERGAAFPSFAVPTILGELRRYRRDTAWAAHVPRALQERVQAVRAVSEEFNRAPTASELAPAMRCSEEDVVEALYAASARTTVPLDGPSTGDGDGVLTVADRLGAVEAGYDRVECLAAIERAIPALSRSQRSVLALHFANDLSQRQIAGRLGISRAEASRVLTSAIATLRSAVLHGAAA